MPSTRTIGTAVAACLLLAAGSVRADIRSTTGQLVEVAAPSSVRGGAAEGDNIVVFEELSDVVLARAARVNLVAPGSYSRRAEFVSTTIPIGTPVNSHLAHLDRPGTPAGASRVGSVTFDNDVIGIVVFISELRETDGFLGAGGTVYGTGSDRAIETGTDRITLSADRRTVTIDFFAGSGFDDIRILTMGMAPAMDAGSVDGGPATDGGATSDGAVPDGGPVDAGAVDAGAPDAGAGDAGTPAPFDAGVDGGGSGPDAAGGSGSDAAGGSGSDAGDGGGGSGLCTAGGGSGPASPGALLVVVIVLIVRSSTRRGRRR